MNARSDSTQWRDRLSWAELEDQSEILPESFYARPAEEVARALLGKILVHGRLAGRIVEVEAYLGADDPAAHASRGVTPRTRVIFGPPGRAYVFFIYGMYDCFNLIAEPEGAPGCVLIRAAEPLCGISEMRLRRPNARCVEELASGPGRLTMAFGITRRDTGRPVTGGDLTVRSLSGGASFEIETTPRIGIRRSAERPLRFLIAGNRFVSRRS